ncbi:MAG: hypothetical protein AAFQ14_12420 [Cyanobacteria bacterium J06621_12]
MESLEVSEKLALDKPKPFVLQINNAQIILLVQGDRLFVQN